MAGSGQTRQLSVLGLVVKALCPEEDLILEALGGSMGAAKLTSVVPASSKSYRERPWV